MDATTLRLAWMRATLRLHAEGDVDTWTDDEVVETFATLRARPVEFDVWVQRMGIYAEESTAEKADGSAEALVSIARATAPNLTVVESED